MATSSQIENNVTSAETSRVTSLKHKQPQTCLFCGIGDDEKFYGPMISGYGITAHNFCLVRIIIII